MIYTQAKMELNSHNSDTREVAQGLIQELEPAFEAVGLSKSGSLLPPAMADAAEERQEDANEETAKEKRLRRYIEREQKKELAQKAE